MRVDIMTQSEVKKVLDCLYGGDALVYRIGVSTGLRISDIIQLRANQLKKRIYIKEQKTGKIRRIYINNKLLKDCNDYIKKHNISGEEKIFKRSYSTYYRHIKQAAEKAGVKKNIGSHSMRKSYAYDRIYNKHYSIAELQKCMNHTHISDTIGYITPNEILLGGKKKNGKRKQNKN